MTRRIHRVTGLFVLASLSWLAACSGSSTEVGKVVQVFDGDLVTLEVGDKPRKVRVADADCPERGQPFRDEAKAMTERLVSGKEVTVYGRGKSREGYTVGVVTLADGRVLGRELVRAGLAWAEPDGEDPEIPKLEVQARSARIGLWSDPKPAAPWEFRRGKTWKK